MAPRWMKRIATLVSAGLIGGWAQAQLATPEAFVASDGLFTDKVRMSWQGVTGAGGYELFRATNAASAPVWFGAVGIGSATNFDDYSAVPGVTYWYSVRATNAAGPGASSIADSGWRRSYASTINARLDFDGDGKADLAVSRRETGDWQVLLSSGGFTSTVSAVLGGSGWTPVTGDYNRDYLTDPAVYAEDSGSWDILLSSYSKSYKHDVREWGGPGCQATPGDYDGDGKTDLAAYARTSGVWSVKSSLTGVTLEGVFGGPGYAPVPADYNGDGRTDPALYNEAAGEWQVLMSSPSGYGLVTGVFGGPGFRPVPVDLEGDGVANPALYNQASGRWLALVPVNGGWEVLAGDFGGPGWAAVPADYNGDLLADPAIYQESTGAWQILMSRNGNGYYLESKTLGGSGYAPVAQ